MIKALTNMLKKDIRSFECKETALDGGTIGDVRLVTGTAVTVTGEMIPFKIVYKSHEKFERPGDPNSWRREYDLYNSDIDKFFTNEFRWPTCYHTEINENNFEIWMEYVDAPSGFDLDPDMLEKAAFEIARWQGIIFADSLLSEKIKQIKNLGDPDFLQRNFNQWHTQTISYEYIVSEKCRLPNHIKKYYIENKEQINHSKSIEHNVLRSEICSLPQHLKQMLVDVDERQNEIFEKFKVLPIILCHRDYWIENIFYKNGNIIAIDWDTTGWGYLGEDIAQLIFDDIDVKYFDIYLQKLIPAYYKGFNSVANIKEEDIKNSKAAIRDFILVVYGYRIAQKHMFTLNDEKRAQAEKELQIIYDLKL